MKKSGKLSTMHNSDPSRHRTLHCMGLRWSRLTKTPPSTMPTMAKGIARVPRSRLAKEAVTENWRSRNLGRKVAMPATMDEVHTWDRTTSKKMGWRSIRNSTLGKTVGTSGKEVSVRATNVCSPQPYRSFLSLPFLPSAPQAILSHGIPFRPASCFEILLVSSSSLSHTGV